jgi:hypothetical protein
MTPTGRPALGPRTLPGGSVDARILRPEPAVTDRIGTVHRPDAGPARAELAQDAAAGCSIGWPAATQAS